MPHGSGTIATIEKRRWTAPSGETKEAWRARFIDQNGIRRSKQFAKKKDADNWLVSTRNQVREGTYTPESSSKTIKEAADAWIERAKAEGLERSTIEAYERERDHALALLDPDTKLARITTARCEQLRDDLLKAHSRAMARKVLKTFKSIMKDAKRRGMVAQNVAADTTIGTAKRHKRRLEVGTDIPTHGEIKALVGAATDKALALVCLAAFAGLRASEIRGLRWSDVDLGPKPVVTISQRADRWAKIGSPKSEAARRAVPLGEPAAQALRGWKLAQPPITYHEDGEKKQRPATLVFGTGMDRPDTLPNIRARLLAPAMIKASVALPVLDDAGKPVKDKDGKPVMHPKYGGLHCLRHYAISSWLAAGFDHKQCQRWAGHTTLVLTLDTYGHLLPRRDGHELMRALERDLFG
jgi:integrase